MKIREFSSPQQVAESFANDLGNWIKDASDNFNIALSGGSTPKILFQNWAQNSNSSDWQNVHFFWGDERCVAPDDAESNFGVTNEQFFKPVGIPQSNIHRVLGESDPETEATRYSKLIESHVAIENDLPQFDVVLLGMGTDGHTASIFPDQMQLMDDDRICAVATHPDNGQKRVTLTGNPIANAKRIVFLLTGESKKEKFAAVSNSSDESRQWPASRFMHQENTIVYLDQSVVD